MTEKHSPPRKDLRRLIDRLRAPDAEMDEATAADVLRDHDIEPDMLVAGLRERLKVEAFKAEVRKMGDARKAGTAPAAPLTQALFSLSKIEPRPITPTEAAASAWIDALLGSASHGDSAEPNSVQHFASFRERSTVCLIPEDWEILNALAAELNGEGEY